MHSFKMDLLQKNFWKRALSLFLFLLLLSDALLFCNRLLVRKDSYRDRALFFKEGKAGRIDALFLGNSHMKNGVNPAQLYEEYGITSYNLASKGARLNVSYWILKNALRTCTPKFVFIDGYYLDQDVRYLDQLPKDTGVEGETQQQALGLAHDALDAFRLSKTKQEAVFDLFKKKKTRQEFLFPFYTYHNRWKQLTADDYRMAVGHGEVSKCLGAEMNLKIDVEAQKTDLIPAEAGMEKETVGTQYLQKIIALCLEKGITPVVVQLPFPGTEEQQRAGNQAILLAKKAGIPCVNLNYVPNLIQAGSDLCSQTHLSAYGAYKTTHELGGIMQQLGMKDHRKDEAYAGWNTYVDAMHEERREGLEQAKDVRSALMMLRFDDFDAVVFINHGSRLLHSPYILSELSDLTGKPMDFDAQYDDSLLVVKDQGGKQNASYFGFQDVEKVKTSFAKLSYLSTKDWNNLQLLGADGNSLVDADGEGNALQYYTLADKEAQIFVFDARDHRPLCTLRF